MDEPGDYPDHLDICGPVCASQGFKRFMRLDRPAAMSLRSDLFLISVVLFVCLYVYFERLKACIHSPASKPLPQSFAFHLFLLSTRLSELISGTLDLLNGFI